MLARLANFVRRPLTHRFGKMEPAGDPHAEVPKPSEEEKAAAEQNVTPLCVEADATGVDYNKLVQKFGCDMLTQEHLALFESITG